MASMRNVTKFLRGKTAFTQVSRRGVHSQGGRRYTALVAPLGVAAAGVGAFCAYTYVTQYDAHGLKPEFIAKRVAQAAGLPQSQPSVFSQNKNHALYLWIHLKPEADAKACARTVAQLQTIVDGVVPPAERMDENEIWAGVGFGPNFHGQVAGKTRKNFNYPHRKGALGDMPSTGGDIFVHAKSDTISGLFDLCQEIIARLPEGSVHKFEDIYSFVYKNGRDLSGFIDGTENAADDDDRRDIAVEKETGGSYVITQKWIHKLGVIRKEKDGTMEKWVGRSRADSIELPRKAMTSHVARMVGGTQFQQKKPFQIVRQSMPYGNVHSHSGLFFIGYAESPENFEFMLDNMVGACPGSHCDDVMRLTECVTGTYWYFPGVTELKKLA